MAEDVFGYDGEAYTREKLIPGDTPTGISDDIRLIPKDYYRVTGVNLLTNGTMEAGDPVDDWTDTAKATNASNTSNRTNSAGTKAMEITLDGDGAGHGSYQNATTVAESFYRLRFYYKNTAADFAQINIVDDPDGTPADIIADTDMANSTAYSSAQDYFFQAISTTTRIYLNGKNNSDVVYFDDVSVCEVDIIACSASGVSIAFSDYANRRRGNSARSALVIPENNTCRIAFNGESPTNSTDAEPNGGIEVAAGQSYLVAGTQNVKNFKVVDAVSGSASEVEVVCSF